MLRHFLPRANNTWMTNFPTYDDDITHLVSIPDGARRTFLGSFHPHTFIASIHAIVLAWLTHHTSLWIVPSSNELNIQFLVGLSHPIWLDILVPPSVHASTLSYLSHGHHSRVRHWGYQNCIDSSCTLSHVWLTRLPWCQFQWRFT